MKILFFINGIHPGGKERRMLELMKGLKLRNEIEFELVLMNREVSYPEIFEMNVPLHFLIRKTKKDISIFWKFYKICKIYQPDFIHCWDSMTAVYAIPVCKLLKIKLMNGMVVDTPIKQNILNKNWLRARLTFPFSDIIIGNSEAGLIAYKAPPKKSICIYNGFNFSRLKYIKPKDRILEELDINTKYIVGMVAAFSKYKDYKTYFSAAKKILQRRSDITFLAIGNNTDSIDAKSEIDKKLENHFRLLGKKTDIESYVNTLDIGVLATFTEGISNSILEYMAASKPVVATEGGGTKEIVINNTTGYLVKVSDSEDLASKIEFLINNPDLSIQMGKAGLERVPTVFSIESMVNKYIALYKSQINSKKVLKEVVNNISMIN